MSLINCGAVCSVIWQAFKVMDLLLKLNWIVFHCLAGTWSITAPPLPLFLIVTFQTQMCHLSLRHFQQLQWSGIAEKRFQQPKNVSYCQALVSVLQTEREGLLFTHYFAATVLLGEIHRRGGRDTDFCTDSSLSNPEGNTAIKHVVFWVEEFHYHCVSVFSGFYCSGIMGNVGHQLT